MSGAKKLVIVESPTKMKSIAQYLGDGYEVLSSVGHIRDLIEPKNLPAELKKQGGGIAKFSVDVDNGFEPYYVVSDSKKKTVAELKRALKDADELLLATDEDREGEAIAWHLLQELKPKVPVRRMVFHEITKDAILAAKDHTRELDTSLVDAQETRRILDRLYGYEVSPVLWRKVGPGLSAGRVQSAATRLVVDRERERLAFVTAAYWDLVARFAGSGSSFEAKLARLGGTRVASGRDFDDTGRLKGNAVVLDEATATALAAALRDDTVARRVSKVESKPYSRRPAAPFTTSTLQQEAARKLRLSARDTMRVAQSLYENGYITYMRTDSPSLSQQAIQAARSQATKLYGADSIPDKPRAYAGKSKNAQEAHEAIRPSGEVFRTPAEVEGQLRGSEFKLYDLIWKRTVASQMADAKGHTATVTIEVGPTAADAPAPEAPTTPVGGAIAEFTASGTVITFRGFLAAYEEGRDEERNADDAPGEAKLPPLEEGQQVALDELEAKGHETSPPPRYTEASLVKRLEELGIGRPSTFASIISTILDRGYVTQRGQALVPSWTAFSVVRLLEEHFGDLVEYDFTAEMEDDLDRIASGEADRVDWLNGFYFGGDRHKGLRQIVDNLGDIDAREINSVEIAPGITLRIGKYGPYLETQEPDAAPDAAPRRVNLPEGLAPDELTAAKAQELIDAPVQSDRVLGENPDNGKRIVVKDGRFGPYVTELEPEAEASVDPSTGEVTEPEKPKRGAKKAAAPKPRTASLFKSMQIEEVDLATALKLLDLPRTVGLDPESGDEITAQNGRYGPYLKKGADTRTLPSEDAIFDIDLAGALELYAQPKYGARRASSALKEFDADPVSGKPVKVKDGRFGPYVTDGTTNATIPRGENVEDLTFERAIELLQIKRDKGPAPARAKRTTTKTAARKPAAKTTTRKAAPKKSQA
ncbi:type I DNA topoisomerase [Agromyces sp. LHK192]|uniref:type I DNA topoisomerase n=1 Tax=Agromyces sp. LHK192 TaxID=2498704 RepID=UPI000FDCC120|nr:type I DNA topoisomerase [Agromyces sp. LHK192]